MFKANRNNCGFVLVTTMLLAGLIALFITAYQELSHLELSSVKSTNNSINGFYAAEAGLNLRANQIRAIFNGYNQPSGVSPSTDTPCIGTNLGSGTYKCQIYTINNREVRTYIVEPAGNPIDIKIPSGEKYSGLSAQEYRYIAISEAYSTQGELEAKLELTFRSRLVPMFQFAAFYNKDLEILPGPDMTLSGPVHTNGDLYLNANSSLSIKGQVTVAGDIYRGRKNNVVCNSNNVYLYNPLSAIPLIPTCSSTTLVKTSQITPYNGQVQNDVPIVVVPEPEDIGSQAGKGYWDNADLRIVLRLRSGSTVDNTNHSTGIEVLNKDMSYNSTKTNLLHSCSITGSTLAGNKAIQARSTLYDYREVGIIKTLEIDLKTLLNCIEQNSRLGNYILESNRILSDDTQGGLVLYFTVWGPDQNKAKTFYGVRLRNGQNLQSSISGAKVVKGMTVATDQALYVMGDYNNPTSGTHLPAALIADTLSILSNAWPSVDYSSSTGLSSRNASNTTVKAAVMAATTTTGNQEGVGGQGGDYNGGLENYPRFLERWTSKTLTYLGSFVSLNNPLKTNSSWGLGNVYAAPNRDWDYDTRFNVASNLPPLSPRFVYLRQELFVRDFDD